MVVKLLFEQTGGGHFAENFSNEVSFEFQFSLVLNDQVFCEAYALYDDSNGWGVVNLNGFNRSYPLSFEMSEKLFDNSVDIENVFHEIDYYFEKFCESVRAFSVGVLDGTNHWDDFVSKYFEFDTNQL